MPVQFYNFPEFLRHNAKWAIWRYEKQHGKDKPSKPPRHPHSTELLSVNEPASWASFDECVATVGNGEWWNGIGFLIEKHLGVTVVDLDYRDGRPTDVDTLHRRIFEQLGSYSELSPSGQGLHIVSLGVVPSARNFDVEVYSDQRFMSVTGRAINNVPLIDNQLKLEQLSEALSNANRKIERKKLDHSAPESADDASVVARGYAASNAAKFSALWEGRWQAVGYPSQSEADFALINMLAHYTPNIVQIRRLFFQSALGQRDKLEKRPELLDSMIAAAFDRMLPEVDFSALEKQLQAKLATTETALTMPAIVSAKGVVSSDIPPPGGWMGELTRWFFQASPWPLPEMAISGALGFSAALCGSAWNAEGRGLNLFILATAPSGAGKDAVTTCMYRLQEHCKRDPSLYQGTAIFQDVISTMIGPTHIASGTALAKAISHDYASIVSIQSEFGLELQKLTDRNASTAAIQLKDKYLTLANRSGRGAILGKSIWADTKETVTEKRGVSFSLVGESVPDKVFPYLDEAQISDGFVGRFLLLTSPEAKMDYNRNSGSVVPPAALIERLQHMSAFAGNRIMRGDPLDVGFTPEAAALFEQYMFDCRRKHAGNMPTVNAIWARAHMKAVKIAALCAVLDDYENPIVIKAHFDWAVSIVNRGTEHLLGLVERGEVGVAGSDERIKIAISFIKRYLTDTAPKNKGTYNPDLQKKHYLNRSLLRQWLGGYKSFKEDKYAFDTVLKALIAEGYLVLASPQQLEKDAILTTGEVYKLTAAVME